MTTVEPEYMKARTLAVKLDVCVSTIQDWEDRGYIPTARRIGQTKLFHWPSVRKAIEASGEPVVESADPYAAALNDLRTS